MNLKKFPSLVILLMFLVASCGTPQPSNQNGSNQGANIEIQMTGTESKEVRTETIPQQNCTGTAEVENTAEKSRTIEYVMEVQNGVSINANGQVGFAGTDVELGATVASQLGLSYGTSETLTRSITVKARVGTDMQHNIRELEIWKVGQAKVSVGGQETTIPFKFRSDFAVELVNSQDLGCPTPANGNIQPTSEPSTSISVPSPTTVIVVATESPLGNAIIGALNNDGTAAIDTSDIGLHPKRHLDAAGTYRATYEDHIWVTPETGTGIGTFNGLEPGNYVVCFGQYGSWVKVGEITIEPYKTLSISFRWPPSYEIGSKCKLD